MNLEQRITDAQAAGIRANVATWLQFVGAEPGDVVELQALKVPDGRFVKSYYAHALNSAQVVELLERAERWSNKAPAVYTIANRVNPAVATRSAPGQWHVASKGDASTSDRDIDAARVLFVDIDVVRPSGTSATDDEVGLAIEVAAKVYACFEDLVGRAALAYGHSGNGRQVFVALEGVPAGAEATALIKSCLKSLGVLFGTDAVKIDSVVSDPKRLVPAFGTMKRKGAPNVAARPHRRTAVVCEPVVERVDAAALAALEQTLREMAGNAAPEEVSARPGRPKKRAPKRNAITGGPWDAARAVPVEEVMQRLGLEGCPKGHTDGAGVFENGHKCFHDSCAGAGKNGFRSTIDLVAEVLDIDPKAAVNQLAEWFGFEGIRPRKKRARRGPALKEVTGAPAFATDMTDVGNAERLIQRYGEDLRWMPARRTWFAWDGRRWQTTSEEEVGTLCIDTVNAIFDEAVAAIKAGDRELGDALFDHARKSRSARALNSMMKVAKTLPGVVINPNDLDADPFLFCCANGVIDLRTGALEPHDRELLISRMSPVAYDPTARSEAWEAFLDHAAAGREGYRDFLQVVSGYTLCGDTSEEKLMLMTGPGGTGKGTYMDAMQSVLGDYGLVSDFEVFMRQDRSGSSTEDLARLAGARAVFASESEDGKRISEARVKSITGGDVIAACFKYGHIFEFRPQFKLVLASNFPPHARQEDSGFWRRMLHVPFDQWPAKPDPDLKARLRDPERDAPAVLAWAVEGIRRWFAERITVPECVRVATDEYRADQDILGEFLREKCAVIGHAKVPSHDLKVAYKEWKAETGERFAPGWKRVCERLRTEGCHSESGYYRGKKKRLWFGIGLLSDLEFDDSEFNDTKPQNKTRSPKPSHACAQDRSLGDTRSFCGSVEEGQRELTVVKGGRF